MKIATFKGIVENGQIRLADNVPLPEKATVYIVVPGIDALGVHLRSPRLAHPEQSDDFKKEVVEEF